MVTINVYTLWNIWLSITTHPRSYHHSHDLVNTIMQLLITPTLGLVILPNTSRPPCWVPAGLCFVSPLFFFPPFLPQRCSEISFPFKQFYLWVWSAKLLLMHISSLEFRFLHKLFVHPSPALQMPIYNQIHNVWKDQYSYTYCTWIWYHCGHCNCGYG